MKRTIYLTESDIRKMVYESIMELEADNMVDEGAIRNILTTGGILGALALGGHYAEQHPATSPYPQTVFYDAEQRAADDTNTFDAEQYYGNLAKYRIERLTGKKMPEPERKKLSRKTIDRNTISRNTLGHNTIARHKEYTPSQKLIDYIKSYETLHEGWKDDGYGNLTTGWGTKQTPELLRKYPNGVYTPEEADVLLYDYINESLDEFISITPNIQMLPQEVKDALYDCYYNIGATKYKNSNSLMTALRKYKVTRNKKAIINNLRFAKANGKVSPGLQRRSTDRQQMAANKDYTRGEDRYFKWN